MASNNFKILFWLFKSKTNKRGETPLYLRVSYSMCRKNISTGFFIQQSKWDSSKGMVRGSKPEAQQINKDHSTWKYFNVYDKGTKQYIKRFYPGNTIPKVLGTILILGLSLTQKLTFDKTFIQSLSLSYEKTFSKTTFINGFNNSATIPTLLKEKRSVVC